MFPFQVEDTEKCPCDVHGRHLEEEAEAPKETWEIVFASIVIIAMFVGLILERIGADHVMLITMTMFMVTEIITVREGLAGFSNSGVITVMILFVVAEGISKTGALDWYMSKLLGSPKTIASAQLRILIPITIFSAFLNNTPIVVVMLPVILQWAKNNRLPKQQLMIPLSFAAIFGGTCTLIGTSTNLVVSGLIEERYGDEVKIGLFDVGEFGVPLALIGIAYVLLLSPYLLPGEIEQEEDVILLGARVTAWSPAAGRTVQRSGLRETGGIYLVSVLRAETGNVHRAVSRDFVLNAGDTLYFTGLVESFGDFCEEHGLEILTNETSAEGLANTASSTDVTEFQVGTTKESLLGADEGERLRSIHRMTDLIRGAKGADPGMQGAPPSIVVSMDEDVVVVGVNTPDRPGLLLDISKALLKLGLELHHTEAAVHGTRSLSIWRTETIQTEDLPDLEQIWSVLNALLSTEGGAAKQRGLRVLRAQVRKGSRLEGKTAAEVDFHKLYKAALVVVPKSQLREGDVLVLQAKEGSSLLIEPPADFYKQLDDKNASKSVLRSLVSGRSSRTDSEAASASHESDIEDAANVEIIWKDLQVVTPRAEEGLEFLTAMVVAEKSGLVGKSANQHNITRLPSVYLVSIDRPTPAGTGHLTMQGGKSGLDKALSDFDRSDQHASSVAITQDDPLQAGDILWFSGSASAVGDMRKIPGLRSYESEEVGKIEDTVFDRRLVQAVVARSGALVGHTVKEARFRSRYGAAVIAVHREGKRVHDHPGQIKLQAGDVLLLEAGPTFFSKTAEHDRSFALLAEVEDSAPPRLSLIVPAVMIVATMLGVYTAELIDLVVGGLLASFLMVAIGCLSEQEARDSINWEIYVIIGSAFGIGSGMLNSGLADILADFLVDVGKAISLGEAGLVAAIMLAAFLISSILTNNAAAALLFPIAMNVAESAGIDRALMSYALMLSASDYMTPYGYQTNLLVYGPGGYTFGDFARFGIPLQLLLWICGALFLTVFDWYVSWIGSAVVLAAVIAFRLLGDASTSRSNESQRAA
jgi:di/tricarboxylate transporter